MTSARTTHQPDCNGLARCYSRALLPLVIAGWLTACGGGDGESAPAAAVCTTGQSQEAVLAWDAVAGATGYRIYYGTAAGTLLPVVDVPGGLTTTTVTTGLSSETTYYFAATALNGPIESNFSNIVCKTIS